MYLINFQSIIEELEEILERRKKELERIDAIDNALADALQRSDPSDPWHTIVMLANNYMPDAYRAAEASVDEVVKRLSEFAEWSGDMEDRE